MKTNSSVRRGLRLKIRVTLLVLALAMVAAVDFLTGEAVVARLGQATACQTDELQAPNVSLGELLANIR